MKPLFSIHEIHTTLEPGVAGTRDTPSIPPKELVVKPGSAFYAKDEDEAEFFLKNGAARYATDAEARDLEPPKAKKTKAAAPADATKKADGAGAGDGANLV